MLCGRADSRAYIIVAVFTVLQLLLLLIFGYTPFPDSEGYIALAAECAGSHDWYPMARSMHELAFVWNVGAVNIVVLFLRLTGSVTLLLVLYSLLKGVTALLLYRIVSCLADGRVALTALLLYVLYPANYGEGTSVLSETPFIFFALLGVLLALRNRYLAAGVVLAFANWIRPMGLVFLLSLLLYVLYGRKSVLQRCSRLVMGYVLLVFVLGGACWLRTGRFIYQARTGWMALLQYSWDNSARTDADYIMFPDGDPAYIDDSAGYDCCEKDSVWQARFFGWLGNHKKDYICQMPGKLAATFVSDNVNFCTYLPDKRSREYMYDELGMVSLFADFPHYSAVQIVTVCNLLYYYLLLVLAAAGIVTAVRKRWLSGLVLSCPVIVLSLAVLLFFGHGEARFHQPIMPFIIMLSGFFVADRGYLCIFDKNSI